MLVLSRKSNEELLIDGAIRVKVIEISNSRVKLGICASDEVVIKREELTPRSPTAAHQRKAKTPASVPLKG